MGKDFLTLLRSDHDDLERGLDELLAPGASMLEIRGALDGVRLGLTAHAEAEDIVLHHAVMAERELFELGGLVREARACHLAQEGALASLVCTALCTPQWRERARHLRKLVMQHSDWEERYVVGEIRAAAPKTYDALAGAFATERLRQLAMLTPSAPIFVGDLAIAS